MPDKRISLALATYNGEKYLIQQLESIFSQELAPDEIIIVDDFSTDRTVSIIREYQKSHPAIVLFCNEINIGPTASFKKAVSLCTCPYIAFCDQDDIWKPFKLQLSLETLVAIENPSLPSMVFTDLEIVDHENKSLYPSFWQKHGFKPFSINFYKLLMGNVATGCSIVINKSMANEIAKMPSNVIMYDFWISLISYGFGKVKPINITSIRYRTHSSSVTIKEKLTLSSRLQLFFKIAFEFKSDFLNDEILQAETFSQMYECRLNSNNLKHIRRFLNLKYATGFSKKVHSVFRWI